MFTTIPYATAILVTMRLSGEFLMLWTTDRTHGRSQHFLIHANRLRSWLNNPDGTSLIDCDLNNYLAMHRFSEDKVTMRFTWLTLHDSHGNRLHGYQQTLIMPIDELNKALIGFRVKALIDSEVIPQCRLSFSESAQELIGKICRDPKEKRALSKSLRNSFMWRGTDEVYLVADWRRDFYFTTDDNDMNGGLCRHESTVRGKNGKAYTAVKYAIHT